MSESHESHNHSSETSHHKQTGSSKKENKGLPKWVWGIVAILVICAVIYGIKSTVVKEDPLKGDAVVAIVNNERIRQSYMDRRFNEIGAELQSVMTQKEFLDTLVSERLLIQQAKELGYEVSPAEVSQAYDSRLNQAGITKEEFEMQLLESNMTEDDLLSSIYNELLVNKLLTEQVVNKINVSEDELKELYSLNNETFVVNEAVRASHILVKTKEEADALKKVLSRDNFADYAANTSIDPSAVENKGDLGFFEKGMMVPAFDAAAFSLKQGVISDPVNTEFGWHILLVTDHKESGLLDYDEVRDFLEQNMMEQKTTLAAKEYLEVLNNIANVEILAEFDEEGKIKK